MSAASFLWVEDKWSKISRVRLMAQQMVARVAAATGVSPNTIPVVAAHLNVVESLWRWSEGKWFRWTRTPDSCIKACQAPLVPRGAPPPASIISQHASVTARGSLKFDSSIKNQISVDKSGQIKILTTYTSFSGFSFNRDWLTGITGAGLLRPQQGSCYQMLFLST